MEKWSIMFIHSSKLCMYMGLRYIEVYGGNTSASGVQKAKWKGEGGCYGVVHSIEASQN